MLENPPSSLITQVWFSHTELKLAEKNRIGLYQWTDLETIAYAAVQARFYSSHYCSKNRFRAQ